MQQTLSTQASANQNKRASALKSVLPGTQEPLANIQYTKCTPLSNGAFFVQSMAKEPLYQRRRYHGRLVSQAQHRSTNLHQAAELQQPKVAHILHAEHTGNVVAPQTGAHKLKEKEEKARVAD